MIMIISVIISVIIIILHAMRKRMLGPPDPAADCHILLSCFIVYY